MARKIFYARRSKRPLFVAIGLIVLGTGFFIVGFESGRNNPDMFAWNATDNMFVAGR